LEWFGHRQHPRFGIRRCAGGRRERSGGVVIEIRHE
jgi:hypothetical protein